MAAPSAPLTGDEAVDGADEPLPSAYDLERCHLAQDDLAWLPPSLKVLRWTIAGAVWGGLGAAVVAALASGKLILLGFWKMIPFFAAGGYWAGDRVARSVMRWRMEALARGARDLAGLLEEPDGELLHVRGRVVARRTVEPILDDQAAVWQRLHFAVGGGRAIFEAAVDFHLVDDSGTEVAIEVAEGRLLEGAPADLREVDATAVVALMNRAPAAVAARLAETCHRDYMGPPVEAAEVLLRPGDLVEVVGWKSRVVDPTVAERLHRETPMRATLRSGPRLPLLVAPLRPPRR